VDHFNTSDAPAKITQRIMGGLSWPRVLVFQTRYAFSPLPTPSF
jgi:hypothetical protein